MDTNLDANTYKYSVTAVFGNYETDKADVNATITSGIDNIRIITSVYPNPTDGDITIESSAIINSIQLYDLNGRLMMRFDNINANEKTINVSEFPSGIYLLKVNDSIVRISRK